MRRRLRVDWLGLALVLCATGACARRAEAGMGTGTKPGPRADTSAPAASGAVVGRARSRVVKHRLTKRPLSCLLFDEDSASEPGATVVHVREKHDAACGGDPTTAPRLFSLIFGATGAVSTDARSRDGQFKPLS